MAEPKQPALSQPVLALLQMLSRALLPASAEAKVRYMDPEAEAVGKKVQSAENYDFDAGMEDLYKAILEAAEREPAVVDIYGSKSEDARRFWAQPGTKNIFGAYAGLGQGASQPFIMLGPEGETPSTFSHELVHFLQDVRLPKGIPGVGIEDYPEFLDRQRFAELGARYGVNNAIMNAYKRGEKPDFTKLNPLDYYTHPLDTYKTIPYDSRRQLYEFFKGIAPEYIGRYPEPKSLREQQLTPTITPPVAPPAR